MAFLPIFLAYLIADIFVGISELLGEGTILFTNSVSTGSKELEIRQMMVKKQEQLVNCNSVSHVSLFLDLAINQKYSSDLPVT